MTKKKKKKENESGKNSSIDKIIVKANAGNKLAVFNQYNKIHYTCTRLYCNNYQH